MSPSRSKYKINAINNTNNNIRGKNRHNQEKTSKRAALM